MVHDQFSDATAIEQKAHSPLNENIKYSSKSSKKEARKSAWHSSKKCLALQILLRDRAPALLVPAVAELLFKRAFLETFDQGGPGPLWRDEEVFVGQTERPLRRVIEHFPDLPDNICDTERLRVVLALVIVPGALRIDACLEPDDVTPEIATTTAPDDVGVRLGERVCPLKNEGLPFLVEGDRLL